MPTAGSVTSQLDTASKKRRLDLSKTEDSECHVGKKPCPTFDTLDTMVLIVAGQEKTQFHFHKGLLCKASPYFRAALEGGFKEAESQTIEWPEEKATIVKVFQVWLYSGSVSLLPEDKATPWGILVDLYVFAEGHDLPALENSTIDYIFWMMEQKESKLDFLALAPSYNTIRPQAPLRRLIVDLATAAILAVKNRPNLVENRPGLVEAWLKAFPKELLEMLVLVQHEMITAKEQYTRRFRLIGEYKADYYSVGSNISRVT